MENYILALVGVDSDFPAAGPVMDFSEMVCESLACCV